MPIDVLAMAVPLVLMLAWAGSCLWALSRVARMPIALVSQVAWAVVILCLPLFGLVAFLLVGDRTEQMERELGIRRVL